MSYVIENSDKPAKKFVAINMETGKRIYFGASGYSDFTIHKDYERRDRYIARHKKHEDWKNPDTPGFWSRWLLWGDSPSIPRCLTSIRSKFGIKVKKNF